MSGEFKFGDVIIHYSGHKQAWIYLGDTYVCVVRSYEAYKVPHSHPTTVSSFPPEQYKVICNIGDVLSNVFKQEIK